MSLFVLAWQAGIDLAEVDNHDKQIGSNMPDDHAFVNKMIVYALYILYQPQKSPAKHKKRYSQAEQLQKIENLVDLVRLAVNLYNQPLDCWYEDNYKAHCHLNCH